MASTPDLRAALRLEVGRLRLRESRRVFDPMLCIGTPDEDRVAFPLPPRDGPVTDAGLRADVVTRLLTLADAQWETVLLIRPGEPHPHDLDLEWLAAARLAFESHGRRLAGFYAITRTGWLDVASGERRTWKRLRL